MWKLFKIRFQNTVPYAPQGNHTERVNRFIVGMIRSLVHSVRDATVDDWTQFVDYVAFAYNRLHIPGTNISPYMLRMGKQPLTPMDLDYVSSVITVNQTKNDAHQALTKTVKFFIQKIAQAHDEEKKKQKNYYDAKSYELELEVGQQCLARVQSARAKFDWQWTGPWVVTAKCNATTYEIADPANPNIPRR